MLRRLTEGMIGISQKNEGVWVITKGIERYWAA